MMKKEPSITITNVKINVTKKKFGPRKLKKYSITIPIKVIIIPLTNSHFQAIKIIIRSISQGSAFGLFLMIPLIPPP